MCVLNLMKQVRLMKQEQRLVAEVYRYLAPFIDTNRGIYLSLDGQAAEIGVQEGLFDHPTIPDFWFTLVGAASPTLIEAKVVNNGKVLLMQSQIQAWRSNGRGLHRPQGWIAASKSFDRFYYWAHDSFMCRLDATRSRQKTVELRLPEAYAEFSLASELALHLLRL